MEIHQSKILNIKHLTSYTFIFLILSFLFFILTAPLAQAGSCVKLSTDDTGPCRDGCASAPSITGTESCTDPGWSYLDGECSLVRTCGATDGGGGATAQALPNPLGTTDIPTLIGNVIKALLGVTGSIALLMFIYGGILWLISAGNEKRVEQGKSVLTWATIGLGIIFTSYILVNFVIKSLTSG